MPRIASLAIDFTTNVAQIANDMSKVRGSVENTLRGIKTVAATAFATFIPVATINQALSFADNLADLRQQTDFTAESLQKFKIIAGENTVDAEKFDSAIQKLTISIGKAREGSKSTQEAFARLGISQRDLATLSQEQIFTKMQDGFSGIKTAADRAALATELFGKAAGPGMAVFMAQGSEAIRRQGDELQRLGAIMSEDLVAAAAKAKDQLDTVGTATQTAFNAGFLGQIQSQFGLISASMDEFIVTGRGAGEIFGYITSEAIAFGASALNIVDAVFSVIGGMETLKVSVLTVVNAVKLAFLGMQEGIITVAGGIFTLLQGVDAAATAVINKFGGDAKPSQFINDMVESLKLAQNDIADQMGKVVNSQTEAWGKLAKMGANGYTPEMARQMDILKTNQKGVADTAREIVAVPLPAHIDRVGSAVRKVRSDTEKMDRTFENAFDNLVQSAMNGTLSLRSLGDMAARVLSQMGQTEAISSAFSSGFSGLFSGIGDVFSGVFGGFRASGGPVSAGKTYVVGERGPELIRMGASGTVVPNASLAGASQPISVTIINNAGVQVRAREQKTADGRRHLRVELDEAVSSLLRDSSSMSSQAVRTSGVLTGR